MRRRTDGGRSAGGGVEPTVRLPMRGDVERHRGGVLGADVIGCEYIEHRGTIIRWRCFGVITLKRRRRDMGGLIYLVGLIVIILFILSFLGLR
jgi:hypothetical protein